MIFADDGLQDGRGYPRPQLRRAEWFSLNGVWDFALEAKCAWKSPADVTWNASIPVPFAPEAPASGLSQTGFFQACWYRRSLRLPAPPDQRRVLLHFGAVDYYTIVWINGVPAGHHEGGY